MDLSTSAAADQPALPPVEISVEEIFTQPESVPDQKMESTVINDGQPPPPELMMTLVSSPQEQQPLSLPLSTSCELTQVSQVVEKILPSSSTTITSLVETEGTKKPPDEPPDDDPNVGTEEVAPPPPPQKRKTKRERRQAQFDRLMKKASVTEQTVTKRVYRCRVCFISASSPSELIAHVKLVHNLRFEGTPVVRPCEPQEDGSDGWDVAMRNLSNILADSELNAEQPSPEEKLKWENELAKKDNLEVEKYFRCQFCFIDFKLNDELSYHMMLHDQDKIRSCSKCGMGFTVDYSLRKHLSLPESSETVLHKCPEQKCLASFPNRKCLLFHLTGHDGLHRCPTCEETFRYSDDVLKHMTQVHILNERDLPDATATPTAIIHDEENAVGVGRKKGVSKQRMVPCTECDGKMFSNIARHMRDCHYKFKCPVCQKGSSSQLNLNQHLSRMHPKFLNPEVETVVVSKQPLDPSRPFQCEMCEKNFTHLCYLSRHYHMDHGIKKKMRKISGSKVTVVKEEVVVVKEEPAVDANKSQTSTEEEDDPDQDEFLNIPVDDQGRSVCTECGQTYTSRYSVIRHLQRLHHKVLTQAQVGITPRRVAPQTDTDEEDEEKCKERCVLCRIRFSNNWSMLRHIKSHHPRYPKPDIKRKGAKPRGRPLKKKVKLSSEEEESDHASSESPEEETYINIIPEEPALNQSAESEQSDLDEDKYEPVAPPESEKSGNSSDDSGNDRDPSVIDTGVNKPPYKCRQCPSKYSSMWNLNRHEKMRHSKITIFNEDKKRVLVTYTGGPVSYSYGKRGRWGRPPRRGRGGGFRGRGRIHVAGRSNVNEDDESNGTDEDVSEMNVDYSDSHHIEPNISSEFSEVKNSAIIQKDSQDATSAPVSQRARITRSSNSIGTTPIKLEKPDSSDSSDPEIDYNNEKHSLGCFECPKQWKTMNIMTRHLRSDHGLDEMIISRYCMLFGSYRCPFCKRTFNQSKKEEDREQILRNHIQKQHPKKSFPSEEEMKKLADEMRSAIQNFEDIRLLSIKPEKRSVLDPKVTVTKMGEDLEAVLEGNIISQNVSGDKTVEIKVEDSISLPPPDPLQQNSLQNTGECREPEQSVEAVDEGKVKVEIKSPVNTITGECLDPEQIMEVADEVKIERKSPVNTITGECLDPEQIMMEVAGEVGVEIKSPVNTITEKCLDPEQTTEVAADEVKIERKSPVNTIAGKCLDPEQTTEVADEVKIERKSPVNTITREYLDPEQIMEVADDVKIERKSPVNTITVECLDPKQTTEVAEDVKMERKSPVNASQTNPEEISANSPVGLQPPETASNNSNADLIKEETNASEPEKESCQSLPKDLPPLPEPPTEKKPWVLNVQIPLIKIASRALSTDKRISKPKPLQQPPQSPLNSTTIKIDLDDSSEDIAIIQEVRKVERDVEKPERVKISATAIQNLPKKSAGPSDVEPRNPTNSHKPLTLTFAKSVALKTSDGKSSQPERLMIIEQPSVSAPTTPTPVIVRRVSPLVLPGDPKTPSVVSIKSALGQFASTSAQAGQPRLRLISHQNMMALIFRCSECHLMFPSKKEMMTHVNKAHTLQALHSSNLSS